MSIGVHDKFCGSFGQYSDCLVCSAMEQKATTKQKIKMRLPSKEQTVKCNHWAYDCLSEVNRLLKVYFRHEN